MPKFTNISDGPRGIYTAEGLVMVEAGGEFDGDLANGETPNEEWFAGSATKAAKEAAKDAE